MEMGNIKITKGGAREGAGRKKSLPDGVKPIYFALTDAERVAVKRFIADMRRKGNEEELRLKKLNEIRDEAVKTLARTGREIIDLYGGRKKGGFEKAEEELRLIDIMAFKEGVAYWEHDNPRRE